jgi:hypothetical protein
VLKGVFQACRSRRTGVAPQVVAVFARDIAESKAQLS